MSAPTSPENVDVLVVGAGPTGLMLANQLARRGVRPLIIDRHSGPAQQSRAVVVQARTMEIYAQLGIVEKAIEQGLEGTGFNMWSQGRWRAKIPFGDIGKGLSPFPSLLVLGQDDNELIMGAHLKGLGVEVQWNTELVAFTQQPGHVDATIRQPDGKTRAITARYVAGCDGARSPVRELSRIGFPGAPYEHVFYVADTEANGSMVPNEVNVYLWRDGFHLFFPMRGKDRWRVIGILPEELRGRDDLVFAEVEPSIRDEAGANLSFKACAWFSTYRIYHRAAEKFQDRRIFLLGDAAHIHSPAGAQGMNTGLQDAYNLAWKLALVAQGRADERLLATYAAERMPVAQRLLKSTDRLFTLFVSKGLFGMLLRTRLAPRFLAFGMTVERVRRLAFYTISQIGIHYRRSSLSKTLVGVAERAPQAGDRFPWLQLGFQPNGQVEDLYRRLDDLHFNLIVTGQAAPTVSGDLVRVHAATANAANATELARVGIAGPAYYLLRPDGHVGLAGTLFDASVMSRYLADCGLRASA